MDRSASASIIHNSYEQRYNFNTRNTSAKKWYIIAGSFLTLCEAIVKSKLLKYNVMAHIFALFHVTSKKNKNNLIFGQDLPQEVVQI